jgi:peroxiredoxin family protein
MASDTVNIVVVSGSRERMQMAAMMASVGAVSGNDVTVFLSMNALGYFIKGAEENAPTEGPMGDLMVEKNVIGFMTLFEQAVELGDAKIYPCSMAMDVLGVEASGLVDYLAEPMGLTKFMDMAKEGQTWTF